MLHLLELRLIYKQRNAITNLDPKRGGSGLNDGQRLWMHFLVDEELASFIVSVGEAHGFGGSRALIEQRSIGDVQTRQARDHRLPVEERLQASWRI